MKQKPHTGSLQKAVFPCFLFNPMRGVITAISNFRIHRISCPCHLILWQLVRLRGVLLYPRKNFTALPILQNSAVLSQSENFKPIVSNHRKNPRHETVKCFGTVAILYHKKAYLRKTSCKIQKDML